MFTTSTKGNIRIHSNMDFSGWLCPDTSFSCWEKMHQFYLHHDLHTHNVRGPLAQWSRQKIPHGVGHEFESPNIITITVTSAQRTPPLEPVLCMWLCTFVGLPT
jgi:hypothetical protein